MHRLDRRIRILRGKRNGAFDPDQYYLERASRAKVARKVRFHLRRMDPVVLITPRWSEARVFLEEFFARFAKIELAGEPARMRSNELAAWKRIPVRLTPRRLGDVL